MPIDEIKITARGMRFRARVAGPEGGRPVLLLHGFPQTSAAWVHQLDALASAGYRAVAPDQRGYSPGARPVAVDAYRMEELVGDTIGIADALGWDAFDLVGHDWGGAVAWMAGIRYPERLTSLCVVSTPHPIAFIGALGEASSDQSQRSGYVQVFQQEGVAEEMFGASDGSGIRTMFAMSGMPEGAPEVDEYAKVLSEGGALTAALNWYRAMPLSDISGIGPVCVPTMYVWSTEDVALGREAAEATGKYVTGPYRFEVLEGVSHWVSEEAPERLSELLVEHLASVEG